MAVNCTAHDSALDTCGKTAGCVVENNACTCAKGYDTGSADTAATCT